MDTPNKHQAFRDFARMIGRDAASSLRKWGRVRIALAGAAVVILIGAIAVVPFPALSDVRAWAQDAGPWFPLAFWLLYVVVTLFPLPRSIWTLAAGILFGPWLGLGIALSALTISAGVSFQVVRALLGNWMRPRLEHQAVATLNAHLERRGWVAIASLRMIAGIPFSILNYAAALTAIRFPQFLLATALGSIPTTLLGVLFGEALTSGSNPWVIVMLIGLTVVGIIILWQDYRKSSL